MFNSNSDKNCILTKNNLYELLKEKDETMDFHHIGAASATFRNCYRAEGENFTLTALTHGILRNLFCDTGNLVMGDIDMLLKPSLDEVVNSIGQDETDKFISEHSLNSYRDGNPGIYNYSLLKNEIRIGQEYDARPKHFDKDAFMIALDNIIGLNVELKEKMEEYSS